MRHTACVHTQRRQLESMCRLRGIWHQPKPQPWLPLHCDLVQGYNLDYMSNEDLGELIGSLTQAVERVRITVQLRRLATKKGAAAHSIK